MDDPYLLTNPDDGLRAQLPHAVDAERGVLGALLMDNNLFAEIHFLKDKFFYDKRHQVIFTHMRALHEMSHFDVLLLSERLKDEGKLAEAGGDEYLADLADIGAAPVNARIYAELIQDLAFRRGLLTAHTDSMTEARHPGGKTSLELLDASGKRLSEVGDEFRRGAGGIATLKEVAVAFEKKITANYQDMSALRGIHPGLERLYQKTQGFHGGDLIILAGRPGTGKTAFGLNLLYNITKQPNTAAICFSLEMSAEQLAMRMLGRYGLNTHKMRSSDSLSESTLAQFMNASSYLAELPVHIDDSGTLKILDARTRARRLKRQIEAEGMRLGMIMIDYLQLMEGTDKGYESRAVEVGTISRGLKALAKELNTPILALSQLNRGMEKRPNTRPMMSDLRESGAIEQDADLILFLHNKDFNKENDEFDAGGHEEVLLIIGKQRNGPLGTIPLDFDKPLSTFSEKSIEGYPAPAASYPQPASSYSPPPDAAPPPAAQPPADSSAAADDYEDPFYSERDSDNEN